jgi:GNAT superfamily N-acetyltransferase
VNGRRSFSPVASRQHASLAAFFVAVDCAHVVGFACGNLPDEPKRGLDAELTVIHMPRSFRCTGTGRRLVAAAVDARRPRGATGLLTWVIAGNGQARAFYAASGAELLLEQPFQGDGLDLVEAGYGWRDFDALTAACAPRVAPH